MIGIVTSCFYYLEINPKSYKTHSHYKIPNMDEQSKIFKCSTESDTFKNFSRLNIPSIYFGGCAFGAGFYNGVYRAMADTWGMSFLETTLIGGDSVGAIFALGLGLRKSPDYMDVVYQTVAEYRSESPNLSTLFGIDY